MRSGEGLDDKEGLRYAGPIAWKNLMVEYA